MVEFGGPHVRKPTVGLHKVWFGVSGFEFRV